MSTSHHSRDASADPSPRVEPISDDDLIELLGISSGSPREIAESWIARASSPPELVAVGHAFIGLEDAMQGFNDVEHTLPAVRQAIENWHAANRAAVPAFAAYAKFLKARP